VASTTALFADDAEHVELDDKIAEGNGAVAGHLDHKNDEAASVAASNNRVHAA
jgi:hypothetical protein